MIDGIRLGAYVLAADPTWVRSSLIRYYDHLDVLVVSSPSDGRGWTGAPVDPSGALEAIREIDRRGIVRSVTDSWATPDDPFSGDTAQRRHALAAVGQDVDWVLQLDTDELLPDIHALVDVLRLAEHEGLDAVDWPMRVLFRRLSNGSYLRVADVDGGEYYEYPGPVAVRPTVTLTHSRRTDGPFLRPVVRGDRSSLQVTRPPEPGEHRAEVLDPSDVIWHNSWARSGSVVRRKIASWGHRDGWRTRAYYWTRWLPAPLVWRRQRDLHPFDRELWPRLAPTAQPAGGLLAEADR